MQYAIEYLLFTQEYVTGCCGTIDKQYEALHQNYNEVIEIARKHKLKTQALLKKELTMKKTLEMYETMINQSDDS